MKVGNTVTPQQVGRWPNGVGNYSLIWRFPKMAVPSSHPELDHGSIEIYDFGGSPISGIPHTWYVSTSYVLIEY